MFIFAVFRKIPSPVPHLSLTRFLWAAKKDNWTHLCTVNEWVATSNFGRRCCSDDFVVFFNENRSQTFFNRCRSAPTPIVIVVTVFVVATWRRNLILEFMVPHKKSQPPPLFEKHATCWYNDVKLNLARKEMRRNWYSVLICTKMLCPCQKRKVSLPTCDGLTTCLERFRS